MRRASGEGVELLLARLTAANAEDVRGTAARIELDVVVPAVPQIAGVAQEIVNLEALAVGDAKRVEIEIGPARLAVFRIEVHDHEHRSALLPRRLAVADELRVV